MRAEAMAYLALIATLYTTCLPVREGAELTVWASDCFIDCL